MTEVIGVRFRGTGKTYYFGPNGLKISKGKYVIVETAKGIECARVVMENRNLSDDEIIQPLKQINRMATKHDIKRLNENLEKEREAIEICRRKVLQRGLEMKLTGVEYSFDRSKLLFYFTSDGRVDFRDLVRDLASYFKTRIELRQIGVRDEAKMLNGLGICGQSFCCARFLDGFQSVSIKMAKEQGLSPNPLKISGSCGRLMCCLKYEQSTYEQLHAQSPQKGSEVVTADGKGIVTDVSVIAGYVKVKLAKAENELPKTYKISEIKYKRTDNKKNRSDE